jgi:protein Tex
METTVRRIAGELGVGEEQIEAVLRLLSEGATVPFLARYRKEATGGLDLAHLRAVEDRLQQVRELDERRGFILKAIGEQGRLTPDLQALVATAETRARLEDLYLPFKQKRRSRANQAREAGLEPLADLLLSSPNLSPEEEGERFVNVEKGVADRLAALDGARWILLERFSDDPRLLESLRQYVLGHALLQAKVVEGRQEKGAKFAEYFAFSESARTLPPHRVLALFRGRKEGVLRLSLVLPPPPGSPAPPPAPAPAARRVIEPITEPIAEPITEPSTEPIAEPYAEPITESIAEPSDGQDIEAAGAEEGAAPPDTTEPVREAPTVPEHMIAEHFGIRNEGRPADAWLLDAVRRAWKMKVFPYVQVEIEGLLREQAERDAIHSYARSLRDLLMAAPAGPRTVMGVDPGLRTGIKVTVVDPAGAVLESVTMFPHQPKNEWDPAVEAIAELIARHGIELVGIGNGTGSRETDRLLSDVAKRHPDLKFSKVIVSEAGASAFASSRLAARELSALDVPLRAAVSVAHRLQDPLAELVKIEPRTIGVGQYQHDVNQAHLSRALVAAIEDCVCEVGVDLNAASSAMLGRVAGLNHRLADNIVAVRATVGAFRNRDELRRVPGVSDRVFEQAAGFLRIHGGDQVLDSTRIHPECYPLVERMAESVGRPSLELIGNDESLHAVLPETFVDDLIGLPTLADILSELRAPGLDPRPPFRVATFKEGLDDLADLKPGMILEGVVTNVATFGAFVDIGVHQDGLVHVSRLADRFVKDPHEVVKAGDIVRVKVLEVDLERKRIALTMRFEKKPQALAPRMQAPRQPREAAGGGKAPRRGSKPAPQAPAPRPPAA